jgi:hypothetical protein
MSNGNHRFQQIAKVAQGLNEVMMAVERDASMSGLAWQDVVFAAAVAMKGFAEYVSIMTERPADDVMGDLREALDAGMRQLVVTKAFTNRAELEAWVAAMMPADAPPGDLH